MVCAATSAFEVTLQGPKQDLHSGSYGGTVQNPIHALVELLGKLHDSEGRITVPGYYDAVRTLSTSDRAEIAETQINEAEWKDATGASQPFGEPGFTLSEQIGGTSHTRNHGHLVAATLSAALKILCRKRPGPKSHAASWPIKTLQQYKNRSSTIFARMCLLVSRLMSQFQTIAPEPLLYSSTPDNPAMQAAIRAYTNGWGAAPVFRREGGSIPIVGIFQNMLHMPVILMGFGLNTDGLHGPNEHFDLTAVPSRHSHIDSLPA